MPHTEMPEALVNLAQALIETEHLRKWFTGLEQLTAEVRDAAFSEMSEQIRSEGKDPALADAVALLKDPKIYQSVLKTVHERTGNAANTADKE